MSALEVKRTNKYCVTRSSDKPAIFNPCKSEPGSLPPLLPCSAWVGFYLHAALAQRGLSVRALIGRMFDLKSEEPPSYRMIAPVYAALPRHAALVMLGDSITAFTDWNALLPSFDVANRGIPGDTTEGVLKRIDSIIAMHPQCVAVMLGVNDLQAGRTVQQISENYTAIMDRLRASGTTAIVQSTLATSQYFAWLNASLTDVNRSLDAMCRNRGAAYTSILIRHSPQ
jgi:hypothetical protein